MDDEMLARKFSRPFGRIDEALIPDGEASYRSARDARAELETMMSDPAYTSAVISRAMTIATEGVGSAFLQYRIAAVGAYLQRKLTAEHVEAQQQIAAAADRLQTASNRLAGAAYGIAFATFIVTAAALYVAVVKG